MSTYQPTRTPVRFPSHARSRRRLDERLWARFPALMRLSTTLVLRVPPRSRLRSRLVAYWVLRSYEIVNRRDFKLALAAQAPDVLISYAPRSAGGVPPDLVGEFHGEEGFRHAWRSWLDAFEDLRLEPDEVTDVGDGRLLVGFRAVGHGAQSGVLTDQRGFTLYTFRGGRVARHEFFVDQGQAERAAGLVGIRSVSTPLPRPDRGGTVDP